MKAAREKGSEAMARSKSRVRMGRVVTMRQSRNLEDRGCSASDEGVTWQVGVRAGATLVTFMVIKRLLYELNYDRSVGKIPSH